jgi:hypothetical protein
MPGERTSPRTSTITGWGKMAEEVGFEPTCPVLRDKSISSRPRYDHFGTPPRAIQRVSRTGGHYSKGSEENPPEV